MQLACRKAAQTIRKDFFLGDSSQVGVNLEFHIEQQLKRGGGGSGGGRRWWFECIRDEVSYIKCCTDLSAGFTFHCVRVCMSVTSW